MNPERLEPHLFSDEKPTEYGRYMVIRKDGKAHLETWNNTGWAYNHNEIKYWYSPKVS